MGLGRHNTRRDGLLPETKTSATRLSKTLMALKTWITRMKPSLLLLSQRMDRAGNRRRPCGPCAVPKPRAELRACRAAGLSCDRCRTLQRLRHLLARLPRRLNSGRRRKGRTPRYGRPRLQHVPCLHPRLPQRSHCPAHGRSQPPPSPLPQQAHFTAGDRGG